MKETIIKQIADSYHKLLRSNNFFPDFNQELTFYDSISQSCRTHLPWEKFILAVETSYFALSQPLRQIIKCDFFYANYSFWWEEYYSRKKYKKTRLEAVETFYNNLIKTRVISKEGEINYGSNE